MKKVMRVITIVVALSFLVSMILVAPSLAVETIQNKPTTKQPGVTQQAPTAPKPKSITQPNPKVYQIPKEKFWELTFDHCVANSVSWDVAHNPLNVVLWHPVIFNCYYKVKTVPVKDINEADVEKWGKGNSFTVRTQVSNLDSHAEFKKEEIRVLPDFTWADVQKWKKAGSSSAPKEWTVSQICKWTPIEAYLGQHNAFHFCVDCANVIEEYGGGQNDFVIGVIIVNPHVD